MNYTVTYNGEIFASGVNEGELNQIVLDLDKELKKGHHRDLFRSEFGFIKGDFEAFIYDHQIKIDTLVNHGGNIVSIEIE